MSKVIGKLRALRDSTISTVRVVQTDHQRKQNRIHALEKKRHELTSQYKSAVKAIDEEIEHTRDREDFKPSATVRYSFARSRRQRAAALE